MGRMTTTVCIDMRCLQDPVSAERGIANHVRNIIGQARAVSAFARAARLVALTDPKLPPLADTLAGHFDEVRGNAYMPELAGPAVLLQPSPMGQPPLWLGRLMLNPAVRTAAIVYDFIPHDEPETYLPSTALRLGYRAQMMWLQRCALFLPISEATRRQLQQLLPPARRCVVTGAAINAAVVADAAAGAAGRARHVLMVGGGDRRKNTELVVRAHARAAALQAARVPLVISGFYPPWWEEALYEAARDAGGDAALLEMPGRVTQDELAGLYRAALCVVAASTAEGFSLPVVEAMAAGAPPVVSDIAAHAELVAEPALRFAPDDEAGLGAILLRLAAAPAERAAIAALYAGAWQRFTGAAVAGTTWAALADLAEPVPAPFGIGGARPRLAVLSPLPPTRSGVADYTAACVTALAAHAAVTVVPFEQVSAVPHLASRYDRVLSVMGNSPDHHGRIFDLLQDYGGACVCHDARLMQFRLLRFGWDDAAKVASEELGREVTRQEVAGWLRDETAREASFLGPLAAAAAPLILHARRSVELVRERFGVAASFIPFAVYRDWDPAALTPAARHAARQRLGMTETDIHIASFGFVGGAKGLRSGIEAVARLNQLGVRAVLHWVGMPAEPLAPWRALADELGVAPQVMFYDKFVNEARYRDFLAAADLGLQLRLVGVGNISGALQDCITAGLPTVADADLAETIEAPDYVRRVPSANAGAAVATAWLALLAEGLHRQRDTPARAEYRAAHDMDLYARRLLGVLGL